MVFSQILYIDLSILLSLGNHKKIKLILNLVHNLFIDPASLFSSKINIHKLNLNLFQVSFVESTPTK